MDNNSGLLPLGKAVLLKMYEASPASGLIVIPDSVRNSSSLMENRGVVLAVGPAAWDDEAAPRCAVGDRVIITKMAGYNAIGPADGGLYRIVNDRDVFCKITKENNDG